jgi:small GTP-binding protein
MQHALDELEKATARLRKIKVEKPARKELLQAVRILGDATSAYADVQFARAVHIVSQLAERIPKGKGDPLRKLLSDTVDSFGGREIDFRRKAYHVLRVLDAADPKVAGEARSLFESAVRAERMLMSASMDAESGYVEGVVRHLEEFAGLLGSRSGPAQTVRMKICLLGEGGVGKTSLIRKFVTGSFHSLYEQTIGTRISSKELLVPGAETGTTVEAHLSVWDIMGHETVNRLRQVYIADADGALLVFSLSDRKSFESLDAWVRLLDQTVGRIPCEVLANKADLKKLDLDPGELPTLPGGLQAQVLQTSAKNGMNVELAFSSVVKAALKRREGKA